MKLDTKYILLALLAAIIILAVPAETTLSAPAPVPASQTEEVRVLSPIWGPTIQRWSAYIAVLSDFYGLDPDFIASFFHQSGQDPDTVPQKA